MTQYSKHRPRISRRDTLKVCLVPAGAIAGGWLLGCSDDGGNVEGVQQSGAGGNSPQGGAGAAGSGPAAGAGGSTSSSGAAGSTSQAGSGGSAGAGGRPAMNGGAGATAGASGSPPTAAGAGASAAGSGGGGGGAAGAASPVMAGWATGGTKVTQGNYPDPFATAPAGAMCQLYPAQTLGPCYAQMPMMREDISSGTLGLPMRLSFLVVRRGCEPVPDATVDIWHSGYNGIYSKFATGSICNPGTEDVLQETFCRGVQATDASGKVNFTSVFPGWYSGRAVHIHFTVRIGGTEEVTSQLYFDDALTTEIQAQGEYKARGMRATTNANDFIFSSGGMPEQILMQTAKAADGSLHAWKVLSVG